MIDFPGGSPKLADRKQFFGRVEADPELMKILEITRDKAASEDELREQRVSFAFGNAPKDSEQFITKESVKFASTHIRLLR
jgi:hypothetical protein